MRQMARQFVVQLANRPRELAHLARALAARDLDIRRVSGVLRIQERA